MPTTVRVGRLTVRPAGIGRDRAAIARQRAESLLASLELVPPASDRAVLVVRRLSWQADRRVPESARAHLDTLYRRAARPGRGEPPDPDAPAVLFADEAELLTCLTRDTLDGGLSRWYWRLLAPAGGGRIGAILASAWIARARWVPAALAALPFGDAARAVSTLTDDEAGHVLRAVLAEFAVPPAATARAVGALGRSATRAGESDRGGNRAGGDPRGGSGRGATRPDPAHRPASTDGAAPRGTSGDPTGAVAAPWPPWLPPHAAALAPAQRALLAVALALDAAPALVRVPANADGRWAWPHAPTAGNWAAGSAIAPPGPALKVPAAGAGPSGDAIHPSRAAGTRAVPDRADAPAGPDMPAPHTGTPDAAAPYHAGRDARRADAPGGRTVRPAAITPASPWAGGVPSRIASALFLVNMLDWLDLPGSWPTPRGTAPDSSAPDSSATGGPALGTGGLGGWAVVELLARHLLARPMRDDPGTVDDPLWMLLATLDGREPGTVPPSPVTPADPVRLVPGWLLRFATAPTALAWSAYPGRVALLDVARGYTVADVPCPAGRAEAAAIAAAEAARLRAAGVPATLHTTRRPAAPRPPAVAAAASTRGNPAGRVRWDATVGGFVAWLLAAREVPVAALARPGRIAVTRTHVDVVLDLEDIDMAARICGLDRDPGWVPDLGRIVAFHFETGG